jgi:hypothetical protein
LLTELKAKAVATQANQQGDIKVSPLAEPAAGRPAPALDAALAEFRNWLALHPDKTIPEIVFLPDAYYRTVAATLRPGSETDLRQGARMLRNQARQVFGEHAARALADYADANGGMLPTGLTELAPYFDTPVDGAVLGRYEILARGNYGGVGPKALLLGEISGVDDDFDSVLCVSKTGILRLTSDRTVTEMQRALHRYLAAEAGRVPDSVMALAPYLKTVIGNDVLSKYLINSEFTVSEKK